MDRSAASFLIKFLPALYHYQSGFQPKFSEGVWLYMCAGNTLRIRPLVFLFHSRTILCISLYTQAPPPPAGRRRPRRAEADTADRQHQGAEQSPRPAPAARAPRRRRRRSAVAPPRPPPPLQNVFAKTRNHGLHALQVIILSYVTPILPPLALYPSCLHTTLASLLSQKSSHTVPHTPLMQTSTLPALFTGPLTKRSVLLVQCWAAG